MERRLSRLGFVVEFALDAGRSGQEGALPLFSVIVPVFNRDPTSALRSIARQAFPDFECVVVDDGSKNGPEIASVVDSLNDSRFRYIRRENGGGGAARNTGIDAAIGAYVAFLDSDDIWLPNKLEADAELVQPGRVVFGPVTMERGGQLCETRPKRGPRPGEDISEYLCCHQGWTQTSTLVFPRSVKSRFFPYATFGQDTDIALRLAVEGLQFVMHPEPSVIVNDDERPRTSRSKDWGKVCIWLENVRHLMTDRAFLAYRGWHIARLAAQAGNLRAARKLYRQSLVRGALPPSLALKAFVQITLPRSAYRGLISTIQGHL